MRKVFVVLVLLGLAISAYAQIREAPPKDTLLIKVKATTWEPRGDSMRLKGNVSLELQDGTVVTADEAFMNRATQAFELQGNVRMKLGPGPKQFSGEVKIER